MSELDCNDCKSLFYPDLTVKATVSFNVARTNEIHQRVLTSSRCPFLNVTVIPSPFRILVLGNAIYAALTFPPKMLVLFIGDFNIPSRTIDLPPKFKKLLVPNKINMIFCTGNCSKSILDYLGTISSQVTSIRGSGDCSNYREKHVEELQGFRIGLSNNLLFNDELLKEQLGREMNVDILVTGSNSFEAYEKNDCFYISPGSCTGTLGDGDVPSFALMDIQPKRFSLYVYKLINDEVKVEKVDYSK